MLILNAYFYRAHRLHKFVIGLCRETVLQLKYI